MIFKKIIFQNKYVELETPRPFMEKTMLNFHFDYCTLPLVTPAGYLSHCPWVPWGSSPILTRSSPAVSLSDSTSKSLSIEGKLSLCDDFFSKIQELSSPGFQRQREQEMPDLVSFLTALPVFSPITLLATAGSSWQLPPLVATMFARKKKMLLVEERKSLVATKNLLGNVDNITSILIISTILFWRCFRALYHCEWIHKTIWSDAIQVLFIIIVINIKIIKNILIIPHIFHQHNLMCENFTQKRA